MFMPLAQLFVAPFIYLLCWPPLPSLNDADYSWRCLRYEIQLQPPIHLHHSLQLLLGYFSPRQSKMFRRHHKHRMSHSLYRCSELRRSQCTLNLSRCRHLKIVVCQEINIMHHPLSSYKNTRVRDAFGMTGRWWGKKEKKRLKNLILSSEILLKKERSSFMTKGAKLSLGLGHVALLVTMSFCQYGIRSLFPPTHPPIRGVHFSVVSLTTWSRNGLEVS